MKNIRIITILLVLAFPLYSHAQLTLNCGNDNSGLIPLTDLGTGFYEGIQGGLYPGGSNTRPAVHQQKGIDISHTIEPLNDAGTVSYDNGQVLFIGMGGSNASNAYNMFIDTMKHYDWKGTSQCMNVKGLFYGGKDLHDMIDTTSTFYWDELQGRLFNRNDTWEQVQIVWILEQSELDTPDIAYYIDYVADQYTTLMHVMLDSMPNLKMVYLSGFHYTGYTHPEHELYDFLVEPKGYWGNLAIKELIERQINGDPLLDFEGEGRVAPYVNWGPYFWADGVNPRGGDFLTWPCEDYRDDDTGGGFHLEEIGKYKEAKMLINFFETDTVASWWYKAGAQWEACENDTTGYFENNKLNYRDPVEQAIKFYPAKTMDGITIEIPGIKQNELSCVIYNLEGEKILSENINTLQTNKFLLNVENYPEGMYVFVAQTERGPVSGNFYLKDYDVELNP
ncbi:MAG: hypothetical protein KBG70_11880 [Chitinophagales bacterium]|nr:hypothetical protein [Chitinophagales bacterium]